MIQRRKPIYSVNYVGWLTSVLFVALSCGKGGEPGPETNLAENQQLISDYCQIRCAHSNECTKSSTSTCDAAYINRCQDEFQGLVRHSRTDMLTAFINCHKTTCSNDDQCTSQAATAVFPEFSQKGEAGIPGFAECTSRMKECAKEVSDKAAGSCSYFEFLNSTITNSLSACIAKPCAEIESCLTELGKQLHP